MTSFTDLGLIEPLLRAVASEGYETPTPIQVGAIPPLAEGRDLLGIAQTGTGKTAAFVLPILQRLAAGNVRPKSRTIRALVLTPTRELAVQIADSARSYGRNLKLTRATIFGGVGQNPQTQALARGVDLVVATPGRLLDLMEQGHLRLDAVEHFVLDEADRMLDMGFLPAVRRIVAALPTDRQTALFSATMPTEIEKLAGGLLRDPARVAVTPVSSTVDRINQRVLFVEKTNKRALLADLLRDRGIARALVFTRTKHGANKVAEQLAKGGVRADAIHGNKSQNARQRALDGFRSGDLRVLVATDIAARGIDVDGVTHVINFDLPNEPESYVHRIGRTARAGADGAAISFCDSEEAPWLRDIEKVIGKQVPVDPAHPWHDEAAAAAVTSRRKPAGRPGQAPGGAGRGRRSGGSGNGGGFNGGGRRRAA
ncbi:ATP-dependent RNA helicase RhlE [Constrictibacter sp. MBR-5]|jgi:ATP-dependent RNA helicase RhlE|uniref:DEAD/DEAH box helicase n=1 Tax=Constrictibacter sp. MBR-5 TaxID=3156467 RepID=UPI003398EFBC